jgi:thiamine biosynthesis lipoprotein ApbE
MSSMPEPVHLSNHHRNTLRQIFEHPVSHNIEWHAVISLFEAVGSVAQQHNGRLDITVGAQSNVFDPRAQKDVDEQAVVDLRRMLAAAGYDAEATAHEA